MPDNVPVTFNVSGVGNVMNSIARINAAVANMTSGKQINIFYNEIEIPSGLRPSGAALGRARAGILPGAPSRTDNMLIKAASGEYVVNAAATARHRALLEQINASGYANGGFVQPRYATPGNVASPSVNVSPSVSLAGARLVLNVDGRQIEGYVREQAAIVTGDALHPLTSGPVRDSLGGYE